MDAPLSRREFLLSLVPDWVTRRNLHLLAVGSLVVLVGVAIVALVRDMGFLPLLKAAFYGSVFVASLFAMVWFGSTAERLFRKSPPVVQAAAVVLERFVIGACLCVFGSMAYAAWQTADDRAGIYVSAGTVLILGFFEEWRKRREKAAGGTGR